MRNFERGQFMPISAMIMFTAVVFLLAIVNVYKVARTKLIIQNLADAAALNLASQEAQAMNVVTDRNEWMNHMTAGLLSPSDPTAPSNIQDCSLFSMRAPGLIPPITCVENTADPNSSSVNNRRVWDARGNPGTATDGAIGYAMLVHTINDAQRLFAQAYNSFLGVGTNTGSSSVLNASTNFEGLLKADIPDLDPALHPGIHLMAWNYGSDVSSQDIENFAKQNNGNFDSSRMAPLTFKVDHDISTRYQTNRGVESTTLGGLLYGRVNYGDNSRMNGPLYGQSPEDVGWMVPDAGHMPTISIRNSQGAAGNQVGVGVYVSEDVPLGVVGNLTVTAKAKAYVVKGSGITGDSGGAPIFRPTYWVKLAS